MTTKPPFKRDEKRRLYFWRQAGKCWLCGRAMDLDAPANSAPSATFDHLIPRRLRTEANKKKHGLQLLAHRACNHRRGEKAFRPSLNDLRLAYELEREFRRITHAQAKVKTR